MKVNGSFRENLRPATEKRPQAAYGFPAYAIAWAARLGAASAPEEGITYIADTDTDNPLASLQAASCTYRIALGPRAGQKVLSLRTMAGRDEKTTAALRAEAHGFSLHPGVRCGAHQRKELERLCPLHHASCDGQRAAAI